MFYEKDIFYTWEDYQEHLQLMRQYSKAHPAMCPGAGGERDFSGVYFGT